MDNTKKNDFVFQTNMVSKRHGGTCRSVTCYPLRRYVPTKHLFYLLFCVRMLIYVRATQEIQVMIQLEICTPVRLMSKNLLYPQLLCCPHSFFFKDLDCPSSQHMKDMALSNPNDTKKRRKPSNAAKVFI